MLCRPSACTRRNASGELRSQDAAVRHALHDVDARRRAAAHPPRQVVAPDRTGLHAQKRLRRGGGAPHHQASPLHAAAVRRDLARVIARAGGRLVGPVVLLVDDDQAERAHRREHRAARPDGDAGTAVLQPPPLPEPLRRRQTGVNHGDQVSEGGGEGGDHLVGQADLGNQVDHRAAFGQGAARRLQEHRRLAGAGHPEEVGGAGRLPQNAGERGALRRRQPMRPGDRRLHGVLQQRLAPPAGDDRCQRLAEGAQVGVRHPARQRQHAAIDQRLSVDDPRQRADVHPGRRPVPRGHDESGQGAATERRGGARADRRAAAVLGQPVSESPVDREVEGQIHEPGHVQAPFYAWSR